MKNVGSTQFSYKYGNQLHMPYTIAILISYLKSNNTINQNFIFHPTGVDRTDFNKYINLYENIDILLCSCYIWNWEITKKFAKKIKEINPKCLIIFGGPQVPENSDEFFKNHSFVDVIVHNEGELVLTNIFLEYLNKKHFDGIKSVSTKNYPEWVPETILKDVNSIPSPYITNEMWNLIDKNADIKWLAIMETVRGCPYACSYCAWGASSYNAVRKFDLDRIYKEIDFFSENQLTYIDCADANFGMFERDVQITNYIVNKKKETGFPTNFKPCWDKKINDRIKYIASALKSVDLLISVGCSLQSLDPEALKVNNRKSVSFKEFLDITDHFKKDGSQSYTEIIRGLPGETLTGFMKGLNKVIYESNIDTVFIYNCSAYEATELNNEEFRKKYSIKSIHSPIHLTHASIETNAIMEYDDIIISSYSFTKDDLKQMFVYSWYMLVFQFLGIIKYVTKYIHDEHNIDYMNIYENFKMYCENNPTSLFGKEYYLVRNHADAGFSGNGWNHIDSALGPINWPIEEATFLRLSENKTELFNEISNFIKTIINLNDDMLDLIKFQIYIFSNKQNDAYDVIESFDVDWKLYFSTQLLEHKKVEYKYKNKILKYADNFDWNTKCIWHGRRKTAYKANLEEIVVIK